MANNNNSANFHNNINGISRLPKSLTTTMPTADEKSEKFELFEDRFRTRLKIHKQLTEDDSIKYFPSVMRGDALQVFKNNNGPTRENLEELLAVFWKELRKTPINGISEAQIPETRLQSSTSKGSRYS